jgi:hypothetical protein
MTDYSKVTISLPQERLARAKAAVAAGEAPTLSALMDRLLAEYEGQRSLLEILAELDSLDAPTPEEDAWARNVLGL